MDNPRLFVQNDDDVESPSLVIKSKLAAGSHREHNMPAVLDFSITNVPA
jgi:hypothetical protein